MKKAVISGDVVSSTSLKKEDRVILETQLDVLLEQLSHCFDIYGRVIKGDYVECVVNHPPKALRVALALKSFVKSIPVQLTGSSSTDNRIKLFRTHGIRLAIGYGELSRYDPEKGIIDGEAIYHSGRLINASSTYQKERVVIKNTLFFVSEEEQLNKEFEPLLALLDVLLSKATSRQCEVLYWKLLDHNEEAIAQKLGISQSVVNQHSTSVGWNSIEKAVEYFDYALSQHKK